MLTPKTPEAAIAALEDELSVWERWALEPDEMAALGRARDALEVLRREHIKPERRAA